MPKFRKKPVVIEAIQWTGNNITELADGFKGSPLHRQTGTLLIMPTLEGSMIASPGDWIIRGIQGEFYPCRPDIFDATYERVEEEANA